MRPTRLSTLAVVALGCAAVTWLLLRVVYNSLPPLPWTGVPALLIVAAVEAGSGRDLRRRIAGRTGSKPADPLLVSRMLVLAKASSLAAAVVTGLTLGFIGYLSNLLSAPTPRHDMINAGITCAAALVLAAAALYLEFCCRVPSGTKPPADANLPADR
jgi:Na+/melibiose symporter-like transporter